MIRYIIAKVQCNQIHIDELKIFSADADKED